MKILLLCYEYPPVGGGGGRMAHQVAAGLVRRGHEVRVQTAAWGQLPKRELRDGVEIFRSFAFRRRAEACSVPEMGAYVVTSFVPTLRHLQQWKPDVVHAHFAVPTGWLAWVASWFFPVPYVLTCHLGDLPGGTPEQTDGLFRWLQPVIRPVWWRAAGISASSSFAVGLAEAAYGIRPELIPNGLSMEGRSAEPSMMTNPIQLLAVGRFNPQKNFPWLLETLAPLLAEKDLPDWQLTLIGDGPQRGEVEEVLRRTGLQARVDLAGWVSEETLREHLQRSQIFLMPSLSEGNPVAALEALKQGLAILGSDTPGLADVIEVGKNGFAVPLSQPEVYRAKLRELLTNEVKLAAFRQRSLELAERFDLEGIVDRFAELLKSAAIKGKHHSGGGS
jgi:glycosyltransferase involved in cell wall biosynthesis